MSINTFVFYNMNTVGYTAENRKNIKLVEFTMMALTRNSIMEATGDDVPPQTQSMYRLIDPQVTVDIDRINNNTGLSVNDLMIQPAFEGIVEDINGFLEDLPPPVCLVSSNGNKLDFKVLRSEYERADADLPRVLCVVARRFFINHVYESLVNYHDLDPLFAKMAVKGLKANFLPMLYQFLFRTEPSKSKRTNDRTEMLLKCVMRERETFLPWADENAERIDVVRPFDTPDLDVTQSDVELDN